MRFIKYENKSFFRLLKFALSVFLFFNCVGAGSCQTKEEKYDTQLKMCVEQGQKDVAGSTECLEYLLKSNPDKGFINIFLAENYAELNQLDKAEQTINIFLAKYSSDSSGYDVRCQIRSDKKDFPAAMKDCLEAIRLAPENFDYLRHYASVVERSGDPSAAADLYGYILLKKPDDVLTLVALGRLYEKTNQLDKALETYERLLKLDFDLKDKVREGVEKLKKRREKELNKDKNTDIRSQEKGKAKTSGN